VAHGPDRVEGVASLVGEDEGTLRRPPARQAVPAQDGHVGRVERDVADGGPRLGRAEWEPTIRAPHAIE
jgi:hypothetical protein